MSILPNQKLTIGELYVSMAVGLILFLLPKDMNNQFGAGVPTFILLAVLALMIAIVLLFAVKRLEAIGAAILTKSVITAFSFVFSIINDSFNKGSAYWPSISDYQLITMLVMWSVPFLMAVLFRMFTVGKRDTNEFRLSFTRFLTLSLRGLMIIYIMILVFRQIIPSKPDMVSNRELYYMPFQKISECIQGMNGNNIAYIVWHVLIVVPLVFSIMVLSPRIRWWYIIIITLAFGLTIEVLQFSLNTGSVHTDDMIMYLCGALAGMILKLMLDGIRSIITGGEERTMLSLDYSPVTSGEYDEESEEETDE